MAKDDYHNLVYKHRVFPNPSNQNFHTKMIETLKTKYTIEVISSRPLHQKPLAVRKDNGIFHYPGFINSPLLKRVGIIIGGTIIANAQPEDVIVVDVLNVTLLKLAKAIKRNAKAKVIGIVTDNPVNLSGASKKYSEAVFKGANICDAFLTLTDNLNRLFNPKLKPVMVTPGLILPSQNRNEQIEKYAFFSGALYERYGVLNLIDAFRSGKTPYKLKIAGHGPLKDLLLKEKHEKIEFLGTITPDEAFQYQRTATVNINPRPADETIELYSIPSKVIDYIGAGRVTLSTNNNVIKTLVGDSLYWINDNKPETIINALNDIYKNHQHYAKKAIAAKSIIDFELGVDQFNVKFSKLLIKVK